MRVAIVPTGRMEWLALPEALHRSFPGHDFYAVPDTALYGSRGPHDGFTSCKISRSARPGDKVTDLLSVAAQEALGDSRRRKEAADLVVILEDLEPPNVDSPEEVLGYVRAAAVAHLNGVQSRAPRTAQVLRERVSFHLASPMIEAWLFGDRAALVRAGVPPDGKPVRLADAQALERFETQDPDYDLASRASCPRLKDKQKPKWLGPDRQRHPKGYLQWLCLDRDEPSCTSYSETEGGAQALRELRWAGVLEREMPFLAAMLEDLAYGLGADLGELKPRVELLAGSALTSITRAPQDKVLRNL